MDIIIKYFNLSTFELLAKIDYNDTTVCLPFTCGQTSRSTVWANGTQNSGLVNFVPESRLPFVQISSIYRKTTERAWNRYQRWLWSNGTRISIRKFRPEKTWLPFSDVSLLRKVSAGTTKKVVFHLLSNRIFRKIWVDGKQPTSPVRQLSKRLQTLHRPRVSQQTQDQNQHAVHARHGQAWNPTLAENRHVRHAGLENQVCTSVETQDHSRPGYFRCVAMSVCAPQITISRAFQFPLHAA